jgi:hypothetical protein
LHEGRHWEDHFTGAGGDSLFPADAFAVRGRQVFVGASLLNGLQDHYDWVVRSYDAIRGTLQWENRIEDDRFFGAPTALKALGGRLYAAGSVFDLDGTGDFTVRAYDAGNDDDDDFDGEGHHHGGDSPHKSISRSMRIGPH